MYTRTSDGTKKLVWNLKGNQGNVWKQGDVTLASKKPFRIVIEGIRGKSYTGDVSLDDLYLQDGNCIGLCSSILPTVRVNCGYFGISPADCLKRGCCYDSSVPFVPYCFWHPSTCQSVKPQARQHCVAGTVITSRYQCKQRGCCFDDSRPNVIRCFKHPRQPTPFPTSPPPTTVSPPTKWDCDFEKDLCKWKNFQDNHMNWRRQKGSTPSVGTGPKKDHTTGTDQGKPQGPLFVTAISPRTFRQFSRSGGFRWVLRVRAPVHRSGRQTYL